MFSRELVLFSSPGTTGWCLLPTERPQKLRTTLYVLGAVVQTIAVRFTFQHIGCPQHGFVFRVAQALRATRDRERGKLRALIAEKRRRSSIEKAKAAAGGEASPQGAAPHGDEPEPDEPLLPRQEWSSPRDMAAAGDRGRRTDDRATGPPVSEPRGGRCRGTPLHRVACPRGGARSGSVNASTRRRRRPGSDYKNGESSNQEGELNARARR